MHESRSCLWLWSNLIRLTYITEPLKEIAGSIYSSFFMKLENIDLGIRVKYISIFKFPDNILCVMATPRSNFNDISHTDWRTSFCNVSYTANGNSSVTTYGHPASFILHFTVNVCASDTINPSTLSVQSTYVSFVVSSLKRGHT